MQIQELNYASLPWIQQSDSVASAMQRMEDEQLKQLPVVEGEHYVGLLNMDLLLSAEDDSLSIQQIIHLLPKPLIHPEEHFLAAVQIVAEQSLQLIPVVSAEGELQGVVEETELMSAVAAFLGLHENGALLVVEKEPLNEFYFQVRELTGFSIGLMKSVRRLTVGNLFLLVLSAIQSSIIIYLTW